MSQGDFWERDTRRAMHPAAPPDPNPRPPLKPMHEWADDGVASMLVLVNKATASEYLRRIGELTAGSRSRE